MTEHRILMTRDGYRPVETDPRRLVWLLGSYYDPETNKVELHYAEGDRDPDPTIEDVPILDGDAPDEPPSPTEKQADETPKNDEVPE